jgi:hypothetical protein
MPYQVNLRRGFYRFWLAVSALWLIITAAFFYEQIASPYIEPRVYVLPTANSDFFKLDSVSDQYDPAFKAAHKIGIQFPNNVILFPANDIPKAVIEPRVQNFLEVYCKPREAEITAARWNSLESASAVGLLPPLALLLLGLVIGWIASGFKGSALHP